MTKLTKEKRNELPRLIEEEFNKEFVVSGYCADEDCVELYWKAEFDGKEDYHIEVIKQFLADKLARQKK